MHVGSVLPDQNVRDCGVVAQAYQVFKRHGAPVQVAHVSDVARAELRMHVLQERPCGSRCRIVIVIVSPAFRWQARVMITLAESVIAVFGCHADGAMLSCEHAPYTDTPRAIQSACDEGDTAGTFFFAQKRNERDAACAAHANRDAWREENTVGTGGSPARAQKASSTRGST